MTVWNGERPGESTTVWRPSMSTRISYSLLGLTFVVATACVVLLSGEPTSTKHWIEFSLIDAVSVAGVPLVWLRWRLVLTNDELQLTFIRTRRVPLREIVAAKLVAREGLVFVTSDGREEGFSALSHSRRTRRRSEPTQCDLAARSVLCAAARLRGDEPPLDYRLPPMEGLKRALIEGGIWAAIMGAILGS